jgi:hypothetical protein
MRRLYLRSWQPRTATDLTRHRGARSVASDSATVRRGFAAGSPRCTWSASTSRVANTKGGDHHGRIDRRARGADRHSDLRAPAVRWLYGRKGGAGERRRTFLPRGHRANRRSEPRHRSLSELRQLHHDVFARPPRLTRVSAARAEDLRLAVQQILEQAPDCPLCDVCLAYMVVGRPITIASFTAGLARRRRDVLRRVEECAGCLRRKVVTVFRPDAPAAR